MYSEMDYPLVPSLIRVCNLKSLCTYYRFHQIESIWDLGFIIIVRMPANDLFMHNNSICLLSL